MIDLVTGPSATLTARVPGTPLWNVCQLVAHLSGVSCDVVEGRTHKVAGEPWTALQVASREGRALSSLVAEWREHTPALLAMLATPGLVDGAAYDVLVHEHDLRGALGLAGPSDPAAVAAVTERVCGRFGHQVEKGGLPALRLVAGDVEWVCGSGAVEVTGRAPAFEWFRALFGRRSASQVLTFEWSGDPSPYFQVMNLFGPLPAEDVREAGAPNPLQDG